MKIPIIALQNISKSFSHVYALDGVSLHVNSGEVVGLIGDNGAGKSTLINVLAGVYTPDFGTIQLKNQTVTDWNASRSRQSGIETVFQDRALALHQTIVRNIFMGRETTGNSNSLLSRLGFMDHKTQYAEAERLMRDIGFTSEIFTPDSIVGTLSGGERQGVAIARALYFDAELIILDEPTTALSLTETEKVFSFVRNVRASGRSVVFIGHNIYHVFGVADRFVVLDRGKVALECTKEDYQTPEELIAFMQQVARSEGEMQSFAPEE